MFETMVCMRTAATLILVQQWQQQWKMSQCLAFAGHYAFFPSGIPWWYSGILWCFQGKNSCGSPKSLWGLPFLPRMPRDIIQSHKTSSLLRKFKTRKKWQLTGPIHWEVFQHFQSCSNHCLKNSSFTSLWNCPSSHLFIPPVRWPANLKGPFQTSTLWQCIYKERTSSKYSGWKLEVILACCELWTQRNVVQCSIKYEIHWPSGNNLQWRHWPEEELTQFLFHIFGRQGWGAVVNLFTERFSCSSDKSSP